MMEEGMGEFLQKMQSRYEELTGMKADDASDIGVRLKILAEQLAMLKGQLEEVKRQTFAQTACGEALERHAAARGLSRKPASFARGEVVFSRTVPAAEDIVIPTGTPLTGGSGQLRFVTVQDAVLAGGQTEVRVPVCSEVAGKKGNLAAGMLRVIISPVQGIAAVNNPSPMTAGEDAESDQSLRQRLMDSYRMVTNGTNGAFYHQCAMSYAGVRSARVLPRHKGRGTVGVVVYGPGVDEQLLRTMQEQISKKKEINVDLSVEQAVERPVTLTAEIAAADGYSIADVRQQCQERWKQYLETFEIGQPLYPALLVRELLSCPGVANCRVLAPAQDSYPQEKEIFTAGTIQIGEMAQRQREAL